MCPMKSRVYAVPLSDQGAIGEDESEVQSVDVQELFIATVTSAPRVEPSAWFSNLFVGGTLTKFKLDTGAEANVLPLGVYSKLRNKSPLSKSSVVLSSYGDFKVRPEGTPNLNFEARGMKQNLPFLSPQTSHRRF